MSAEATLAATSPTSDPGVFSGPVLLFALGSEVLAIAADCVREILDVPPITRVPGPRSMSTVWSTCAAPQSRSPICAFPSKCRPGSSSRTRG